MLLAGVLAFGALSPPERCPVVTADGLRDTSSEVVAWFERNQNADGSWLYLYQAPTDTIPDDYNVVRHAGAIMGLYMAAGYGVDDAFDVAERGLQWSMARLIQQRRRWTAAATSNGEPSVGATALLLAGLIERHETDA